MEHRSTYPKAPAFLIALLLLMAGPTAYAQPANDLCANATLITNGTFPFSSLNSTGTDVTSCSWNDHKDIWFLYTATCDGIAKAGTCTNTSFDTVIAAFPQCDGSELACNDDYCNYQSMIFFPVVAGSSYYIRISGYDGATGFGQLRVNCLDPSNTPPNDDCTQVVPATISIPGSISFTGTTVNSTDDSIDQSDYPQVWEAFTIDTCTMVTVSFCGSPTYTEQFFYGISSGCPATADTDVIPNTVNICADYNVELVFYLLPAGTYYAPVFPWPEGPYSMTVTTSPCPAPPANDECANAQTVSEGSTPFSTIAATGSTAYDCGFQYAPDVWFTYEAECTGAILLSVTDVDDWYTINVFDACDGSELSCNSFQLFVTAGETYWIRLAGGYGQMGAGTLNLTCIDESLFPPNNDCAQVIPVQIPVPGSHVVTGITAYATDNSVGQSYWGAQVWEAFTIDTCASVTISYCGSEPSIGWIFIGISTGCPATFPDNYYFADSYAWSCPDFNPELHFTLQPGTYYLPVWASGEPYTLTVTTAPCSSSPGADECVDAIPVLYGTTPFSTLGATGSESGCASLDVKDIWYAYTASCTDVVTIGTCGSDFPSVLSVLDECTGVSFACDHWSCDMGIWGGLISFDAVAGTTYLIRIAGYQGTAGTGELTISCGSTSIASETPMLSWRVYPNPTDGAFTVVTSGDGGMAQLELFDALGRMIISEQRSIQPGVGIEVSAGDRLSPGTYILRVLLDNGRYEQRLMVY